MHLSIILFIAIFIRSSSNWPCIPRKWNLGEFYTTRFHDTSVDQHKILFFSSSWSWSLQCLCESIQCEVGCPWLWKMSFLYIKIFKNMAIFICIIAAMYSWKCSSNFSLFPLSIYIIDFFRKKNIGSKYTHYHEFDF